MAPAGLAVMALALVGLVVLAYGRIVGLARAQVDAALPARPASPCSVALAAAALAIAVSRGAG